MKDIVAHDTSKILITDVVVRPTMGGATYVVAKDNRLQRPALVQGQSLGLVPSMMLPGCLLFFLRILQTGHLIDFCSVSSG